MENLIPLLDYRDELMSLIKGFGGMHNAHAHIDRAYTNHPFYWKDYGIDPMLASTYPLHLKQNLIGDLHKSPAYTKKNLIYRMSAVLHKMRDKGTKRLDTLIDATSDIGLIAIKAAIELKKQFKGIIDLRIGPQPIFGFKTLKDYPERWKTFQKAAKICDFLGGLPEKDAFPDRIGYDNHLKLIIELGIKQRKEVHIHVDQGNVPDENGTETLVEAVRWLGSPHIEGHVGPTVWAIHSISPSCYDEDRFRLLLDKMKKYNIGLICCPRAALTMRQLRPIKSPIHNSIARLLDIIKAEIPVRIGTDNIADIFIPSGSPDMVEELIIGSDALRYNSKLLWAKLACGIPPNDMDRDMISRALRQDCEAFKNLG